MRRLRIAATLALVVVGALALGAPHAPAEVVYRAGATASAVHGFYDHDHLFPVPILDLSAPYADTAVEPGPSSSALGSFVWEPEVADLGTIFCILSNNQFCQFPSYPFQASDSYPRSKKHGKPPTLTIDQKGAPIRERGADESAGASAHGASASATVSSLQAVPMSKGQDAAARGLATALSAAASAGAALQTGGDPTLGLPAPSPTSGPAADPARSHADPWLIEVSSARAKSRSRSAGASGSISAAGASSVHGLAFLGGLVTVDQARGAAAVVAGSSLDGNAGATYAGLRVGDYQAELGPDGIRITDKRLAGPQLAAVQAALDRALKGSGLSVSAGSHTVSKNGSGVTAEAYAFALGVERQIVPEQGPGGTTGADILQVPVGYARAQVEAAAPAGGIVHGTPGGFGSTGSTGSGTSGGFGSGTSGPPSSSFLGGSSGGTGSGTFGGASGGGGHATGTGGNGAPRPQAAPRLRPVGNILDLGVPLGIVLLVGLAAIGFVVGMTWLKTLEALTEAAAAPPD